VHITLLLAKFSNYLSVLEIRSFTCMISPKALSVAYLRPGMSERRTPLGFP